MTAPAFPSDATSTARARVRRTRAELRRVRQRFDAWLAYRRSQDAKQSYQQFTAQLGALGQALDTAFDRIEQALQPLESHPPSTGAAFSACALHDLRLAWVQRVWFYFRSKFDQRDDPELRPLLMAADEVVWSCYKPAFEASGEPLQAAPLPYVEPLFTPNAILRDEPPRELLWNTDDAFARSCLASLPIPIIGLPASALGAPWLLALLAHEVGHHVQADLDAGPGTWVSDFNEALRTAAAATAHPEAWLARGREVFADLFSVLAIGGATLPVVAELILAESPAMARSFDLRYPPPVVRLALIRETSRQLGLPAPADPHALPAVADVLATLAAPNATATANGFALDLQAVPGLATAALGWSGPAGLEFPRLLGWSAAGDGDRAWSSPGLDEGGSATAWAEALTHGDAPVAAGSLEGPRLLIGAGALAWARLVQDEDDAQRDEQLASLSARLVTHVPQLREQKTRAGHAPPTAAGQGFADQLMTAEPDVLGWSVRSFPAANENP